MKKNNRKIRIIIILLLLLLTTGCTKTLTDSNNKAVKNTVTGQTLTANILCQPTNNKTRELYKENGVKIDKLPKCSEFKITSGKYEGLWTAIFVKPLAFFLLVLGEIVGNYGISVIIISLIIRFIAYPITKKTAMQSEVMKKAQPEINRIQNARNEQEMKLKDKSNFIQKNMVFENEKKTKYDTFDKFKKINKREPLLTFEIKIRNKYEILDYYEGEDIVKVAELFVKKNNLTKESKKQIIEAIQSKLK